MMQKLNSKFLIKTILVGLITVPLTVFSTSSNADRVWNTSAAALEVAAEQSKIQRGQINPTTTVDLYPKKFLVDGFEPCKEHFLNFEYQKVLVYDEKWKLKRLCSDKFAVLYSGVSKTPLIVAERLTKSSVLEDVRRAEFFFPDPRVKREETAMSSDYEKSGYDRGHMAAAAHMPDDQSMAQSFAFTNITPQKPNNNRRIWSKIEQDVRKYLSKENTVLYVYSGPLFEGQIQVIGKNKVWVPSHFFKIVQDSKKKRTWAYLIENRDDAPVVYMEYKDFVARTSLNLFR